VGDGNTIMLGLQNEREWLMFCEKVLLDAGLAQDQRFNTNSQRHLHREALKTLIDQCFAALSITAVEARLDEAKIAHARMNTMAQLWDHPQLSARKRWKTWLHQRGRSARFYRPG
jgi:itaconate CoA-transferase